MKFTDLINLNKQIKLNFYFHKQRHSTATFTCLPTSCNTCINCISYSVLDTKGNMRRSAVYVWSIQVSCDTGLQYIRTLVCQTGRQFRRTKLRNAQLHIVSGATAGRGAALRDRVTAQRAAAVQPQIIQPTV